MNALPLDGLLVVSLEQAVAAPFCTVRLAEAGARVIKIERPEGDFARYYDNAAPADSSYFVWLNGGKESVVLDLRNNDARAKLSAMIAKADILVQNLKPGAMARLGFAIERLREEHPSLICCSISGYGDVGPLAARKAYDLLIQAETGLASITGSSEAPARVGISIVDIATGTAAHAAILEAIIARASSGQGTDIRISMFDIMANWLTVPLLNAESGKTPARAGLSHPSIAPYGLFMAADGEEIILAIQSEREWRVFCNDILDDRSISDNPRFSTNVARVANRVEIDKIVANSLAQLPIDKLINLLNRAEIAFAQLNEMAALSRHPHLRRQTVTTSNGPVSFPTSGVIFDGLTRENKPVPALGEHSKSVLEEFTLRQDTPE